MTLAAALGLAVWAGHSPAQTDAPTSRPFLGPGGGPRPPRDGTPGGRDGMPGGRDGKPGDRDGGGPRNGQRGGPGGNFGRDPTDDEWAEIDRFMAEHTPVWHDILKRAEAAVSNGNNAVSNGNSSVSRDLRRLVAMRFREIQGLRDRNSPAYNLAVKRLEIEDKILGTMRDLKAPNANAAELNKKLDGLLREAVDNSLLERGIRIDYLRSALDRETKSLEADKKDVAGQVDKQRQRYERDLAPMMDFVPPQPTTAPAGKP